MEHLEYQRQTAPLKNLPSNYEKYYKLKNIVAMINAIHMKVNRHAAETKEVNPNIGHRKWGT